MPDLKVAFWNVNDLYEPGCGALRAPRSEAELDAKVAAVAEVVNSLFGGAGPDLIGLCEIHTDRILNRLVGRLSTPYRVLWEPCRNRDHAHTGLAVLARSERFTSLLRAGAYSRTARGRPRYLTAECRLQGLDTSIFFVVNHWRSRVEVGDSDTADAAADRLETARTLGDWWSSRAWDTCAVVIGDFNAEPFEEPFGVFGLGATRHFSPGLALPSPGLYSTAWRFLSEPDPCEKVIADGAAYRASRTKTTLDAYRKLEPISVVFDHLLVSPGAIWGGPILLQEATVQYAADARTSYRTDGHVRPRRWRYNSGEPTGASDHLPLIATFRVCTERQP